MGGDGDGWVHCARGHRHWGRFGAAGLLLTRAEAAILQHRAPWTHEGDKWGLLGGARDSHEDVVATALREAYEEGGIDEAAVDPLGWWVDDHGGWSYTTVVGHPRQPIAPHAANPESTEVRWWAFDEIDALPLHHGFAGAWPRLCRPPAPLSIVVDSANVVGSRPDGWWHDRLGAARRLRDQVAGLVRAGIAATSLPSGVTPGELSGLLPAVVLVVEGDARPLADERGHRTWWDAAITVTAAEHDGDSCVVEQARQARSAGAQTVVVSADRGLRQRLDAEVHVTGPTWLHEQIATTTAR